MTIEIPTKANRVLNLILLCLILILIRVWYLGVVQHDKYVEQARRPQRKVVIEPAPRATISDRFGIPLAVNKMQYNAAVCYAHVRDIPSIQWVRDEKGKAKKIFARSEHITALAKMLAGELNLDPQEIEDTIHGKASLFPHTPFLIKEDITEEQYYRLRMLEKDWIGLHMQKSTHRFYPQGKVACDILGFLGPIGQSKYLNLSQEMQELEEYLTARDRSENPILPRGFDNPLQARKRFEELQEMSYTINDLVGKAGVEASYEEELRGLYGKKIYEVDVKGNFLRELPLSKLPVSGKHLTLTISSELQATAEELLAAMEGAPKEGKKDRWIRGCAAIAIIPQTGEVVAMASYPRFDPNDFIPSHDIDEKKEKEKAIQQWLESEAYIGEIWDGKRSLEREYFSFATGKYEKESVMLTWEHYLNTILPEGELRSALRRITTLEKAWNVHEETISLEEDRLLLLDLLRLHVDPETISLELRTQMSDLPLADYHLQRQAVMRLEKSIKAHVQELFHDTDFKAWRASSFKDYLKRKRKEEKTQKKHSRPYTEYLDLAEKTLFSAFWENYKQIFLYTAIAAKSPIDLQDYPQLTHYLTAFPKQRDPALQDVEQFLVSHTPMIGLEYLKTMRGFHDLNAPLSRHYPRIRKGALLKNLAAAFYPINGYGYGRSVAFRQQTAPGSVFKVVTAYQAMMERFQKGKSDLNPLTVVDDLRGDRKTFSPTQILGYTLSGTPIKRVYKGGVLPRSSHAGFGKIDILGALEQSSNLYFALVAGDHLEDPNNLAKAARLFGFGGKTGIDLPGEVPGCIPDDLGFNKTGLYSFAIGHHTFDVTPLQTAMMTSFIANKGIAYQPYIVKSLSGEKKGHDEDNLIATGSFRFQEPLSLVGIDFPLFTQSKNLHSVSHESPLSTTRRIDLPGEVYQMITEGMRRSVQSARGISRPAAMRNYIEHPTAIRDYYAISKDLVVKTGTAQVMYKETLDAQSKAVMKSNTCFAVIAYPSDSRDPELVVVVSIRHGHAGNDGGPIAAQIIKKWRELKTRYNVD